MNEKLNIQDLTDQLAESHGLSKKNAESFVKDFFTVIEEALEKDKYVKVKGLGTFKLIDVDSRESIDVNTGERIEIQGHSKISFTPDTTLKEVVNKPFSAFETVVLSDEVSEDAFFPTNDIGEDEFFPMTDTTETESLLEEPAAENADEMTVEEPVADKLSADAEPAANDEITPEEETIVEAEPEPEEKPIAEEEVPVEETASEESLPSESTVRILPIFDDEEIKRRDQPVSHQEEVKALKLSDEKRMEISKKAEGSSTPYLMFAAVLIIFLCLGAVAYLYYPDLASQKGSTPNAYDRQPQVEQKTTPAAEQAPSVDEKTQSAPEQTDKVVPSIDNITVKEESVPAKTTMGTTSADQQPATPVAAIENGVQKLKEGVPYKTDGDLATYTIQKGETLNMVARKFYGAGPLYTYIVSYNKNVIKNPDNVPAGTTIKIPKLVKK